MKPKVKEKWRKDATIKVKTLLEVTEYPKGCFTNKEKLINIEITEPHILSSSSFKLTKKGLKEALNWIREVLYL